MSSLSLCCMSAYMSGTVDRQVDKVRSPALCGIVNIISCKYKSPRTHYR